MRRFASGSASRSAQIASACASRWAITPSMTRPASAASVDRASIAASASRPCGRPSSTSTIQSGAAATGAGAGRASLRPEIKALPVHQLERARPAPARAFASASRRSAASGDGTASSAVPAPGRHWMQPQGGGRDHAQRALGPDQQVAQVIAGVVLAQPFQPVQDRAIGQHRLQPQAQVARIAVAQHVHAARIGRQHAADPRRAFRGQRQREQPARILRRRSARRPASPRPRPPARFRRGQTPRTAAIRSSDRISGAEPSGMTCPPTSPVPPPQGTMPTRAAPQRPARSAPPRPCVRGRASSPALPMEPPARLFQIARAWPGAIAPSGRCAARSRAKRVIGGVQHWPPPGPRVNRMPAAGASPS